MIYRLIGLAFLAAISSVACAAPTSSSQVTRSSTDLSPAQLKYALIEEFGAVGEANGIFYCDPDEYPVAVEGREQERALEQFESIRQDREKFQTILQHIGLEGVQDFSAEQKLLIYREDKKLNAIQLESTGQTYTFRLRISDAEGNGFEIEGNINRQGAIEVLKQEPTIVTCPICLAEDTLIATPAGPIAVQDLQVGMAVWTLDRAGARVSAIIVKARHTSVPVNFQLVHLLLDDGRELRASPRHPLADGRLLGDVVAGDTLDGASVARVEYDIYRAAVTYDILPDGETGIYWANGVPVRSTLSSR